MPAIERQSSEMGPHGSNRKAHKRLLFPEERFEELDGGRQVLGFGAPGFRPLATPVTPRPGAPRFTFADRAERVSGTQRVRPGRRFSPTGSACFISPVVILLDIGNTNVHCGLGDARRVRRRMDFSTTLLTSRPPAQAAGTLLQRFVGSTPVTGAVLCSVVPRATVPAQRLLRQVFGFQAVQLSPATLRGIGIDYPKPDRIGQDRLANALAARHHFGAPVVVVDFGTAVTFDVVNRSGDYVGGVIAPGLAMMTEYLHERTALLPKIRIREPRAVVGRSTEQAMLAGAAYGYRGMVRELILALKRELKQPRLPVVATGAYAAFVARKVPEITAVRPGLALEGLRLLWKWPE